MPRPVHTISRASRIQSGHSICWWCASRSVPGSWHFVRHRFSLGCGCGVAVKSLESGVYQDTSLAVQIHTLHVWYMYVCVHIRVRACVRLYVYRKQRGAKREVLDVLSVTRDFFSQRRPNERGRRFFFLSVHSFFCLTSWIGIVLPLFVHTHVFYRCSITFFYLLLKNHSSVTFLRRL